MRHKLILVGPWLSRLFLILSASWAGLVGATDVRFVGSVGYSHFLSIVVLNADQIRNYASLASAPLRMELWATSAPFAGSFAGGHQLAAYGVGPIAAGASVLSVNSGGITWNEPPSGAWYVAMVLTEQSGISENGGFSPRNWLKFPKQISGNGPPPTDTTPPTVSIASPTSGNVAGTVTISADASDNVGVARVDFYVKGVLVGSDATAPFQYSWNTTTLANGSATLYAKAFDAAGNSAQSAAVTVNVANAPPPDTTPPTVNITSPTGGNVSGMVTISANASDNVGVARVDFYVNGRFLSSREEFHTGGTLLGSDATAPYQISWSTAALANGTATLYAKAFDAVGNSTVSAIVTVDIANGAVPPSGGPITSFAIEYYNSLLDHYFVSASATDINMLDSGGFVGWSRTGYAFKVYEQTSGTANPVCRFYLPPAFGDSHFYSASPVECADVLARFPMFVRESSAVFYANLPDPETGACPASMTPVYRMWNGRSDANHRYVTDPSLRDQLVMKGYVAEGYGPDAVSMCAPM